MWLLTLAGLLCSSLAFAKDEGKFGTQVEFVASPKEAADQAKKGEKLVFVLHVSGEFETPDCT
jgi:hypothetical protein